MTSAQIKAAFKAQGLKVAVRTIPSARPNPWIEARIRPNPGHVADRLTYPASFDEATRRKALAIVYGIGFALRQSAGGNIGDYSISLHASEWAKLFDAGLVFDFDSPYARQLVEGTASKPSRQPANT